MNTKQAFTGIAAAVVILSGCAGLRDLRDAANGTRSTGQTTESQVTKVAIRNAVPVATPTAVAEVERAQFDNEENVLVNLYQRVNPSVVSIAIEQKLQNSSDQQQAGSGSGFVIDKEGYIITNNHVVAEADGLLVTFSDGTTTVATVIGRDPDADLALIKVSVAVDPG